MNINFKSFGNQKYEQKKEIKCWYTALAIVNQIMSSQTKAAYLSNRIVPYNDFLG